MYCSIYAGIGKGSGRLYNRVYRLALVGGISLGVYEMTRMYLFIEDGHYSVPMRWIHCSHAELRRCWGIRKYRVRYRGEHGPIPHKATASDAASPAIDLTALLRIASSSAAPCIAIFPPASHSAASHQQSAQHVRSTLDPHRALARHPRRQPPPHRAIHPSALMPLPR